VTIKYLACKTQRWQQQHAPPWRAGELMSRRIRCTRECSSRRRYRSTQPAAKLAAALHNDAPQITLPYQTMYAAPASSSSSSRLAYSLTWHIRSLVSSMARITPSVPPPLQLHTKKQPCCCQPAALQRRRPMAGGRRRTACSLQPNTHLHSVQPQNDLLEGECTCKLSTTLIRRHKPQPLCRSVSRYFIAPACAATARWLMPSST
jgi:hypothetical protein